MSELTVTEEPATQTTTETNLLRYQLYTDGSDQPFAEAQELTAAMAAAAAAAQNLGTVRIFSRVARDYIATYVRSDRGGILI